MLSVKRVTESRALRFSVLLLSKPIPIAPSLINPSSSSSSTTTSSSCFCYYSTSQVVAAVQGGNNLNSNRVLVAFKEWFNLKPQKSVVFDRIFEILSAHDNEDLGSCFTTDSKLSQLGIRLDQSFVLEVLAYGKNKDVLSCLKFFDWAGHQPGFRHTHVTFHAIFKILSKKNLLPLLLDFLDNYKKDKYYTQGRFYDTLVVGYAVAGKPQTALQLFGKLRFQGLDLTAYSYHVLLNSLVEFDCFDAVGVISSQISSRGFENDVTRTILLKSLCKQKQLDEAVAYMRKLVSEGQRLTRFMISSVVDALCEGNMFEQASKLLEDFRDCDPVELQQAYGVWLRNLVQSGRINEALEFLKTKKLLEGYVPEVCRYNVLVYRLLRENRLMEVFDLFKEMKENHICPDRVTMNTAMCFFCKAGMVDVAIELYHSRSEFGWSPNGMVYNYLINSLCGDGSTDEAYVVLKNSIDQGIFPGRNTLSILADALCRQGKLEKMKDLVVFALDRDIMPSNSMYGNFISALCRAGRVEDGYLILEKLCRMNIVLSKYSYIKLIQGFSKSSRGDIAARLFVEMQEKGHEATKDVFKAVIGCFCAMANPGEQVLRLLEMLLCRQPDNIQIYNFFIYGAGHAKRPDLARAVYEMMQRSGFEPVLVSHVFMLQSYLKSERISDAVNFFCELSQRGRIHRKLYNAMIVGLCKAKKENVALDFMREMNKNGMVPSMESYEEIIKQLCATKNYDMVVHLINDLEKNGRHHVTSFIGNTLLSYSMKTKDLYEAWIRLRGLQNEESRMSLLGQLVGQFSGCIKVWKDVEDLENMIEQCFPLDTFTYNLLLRQLNMSERHHAWEFLNRMCRRGYEPNQYTYAILKQMR